MNPLSIAAADNNCISRKTAATQQIHEELKRLTAQRIHERQWLIKQFSDHWLETAAVLLRNSGKERLTAASLNKKSSGH